MFKQNVCNNNNVKEEIGDLEKTREILGNKKRSESPPWGGFPSRIRLLFSWINRRKWNNISTKKYLFKKK
jgi:hypothetical protein